jgi:small redox-active disulfide protein 2
LNGWNTSRDKIKKEKSDMEINIRVLGPGCPKCKQVEEIVREAVQETGIQASIVKVTDVMEIATCGVFVTPAVMIDGQVKSVGKIPEKEEIKRWLQN